MDNRVTFFYQILHTAGWFVERMGRCNLIRHLMGKIEDHINCSEPYFLIKGLLQMIFSDLRTLIKISLSNDIGHLCFDDLKTILFQISFNLVVGSRMKIQKIFSYDQHFRFLNRTVICYLFHPVDGASKAFLSPGNTAKLQTGHQLVHGLFKCLVRASWNELVRTDLTK